MREFLKVSFDDLVGTHGIHGVHIGPILPSTGTAFAEVYNEWDDVRIGDWTSNKFVEYLGWRQEYWYLTLMLTDGRFTFSLKRNGWRRADQTWEVRRTGLWEPEIMHPSPAVVVSEFRAIPSHARISPAMYAVDEYSGLVCLEFGSYVREDDPNMRECDRGLFRWENGQGWDSPLLHAPSDVLGIEIHRKFEFTPKRVGGQTRGSRKGNF